MLGKQTEREVYPSKKYSIGIICRLVNIWGKAGVKERKSKA